MFLVKPHISLCASNSRPLSATKRSLRQVGAGSSLRVDKELEGQTLCKSLVNFNETRAGVILKDIVDIDADL